MRMESESQSKERDLRLKALIGLAARELNRTSKANDAAIPPSQRRVLRMLATQGALTQQRMLDELELAPASLSEVISKLSDKGLVSRERLESDKRIVIVELTDAGNATAKQMLVEEMDAMQNVLAKLTEEEKMQLEKLLERIACT